MKKIQWLLCTAADRLNAPYTMFAVPDLSTGAPAGALRLGVYCQGAKNLQWITIPGAGTYCRQVMRERRQIAEVSCAPQTLPDSRNLQQSEPLTAYLGNPIPAVTGGAIGALAALHPGPRIWSEDNRRDVTLIAQWFGRELAPPELRDRQATAW